MLHDGIHEGIISETDWELAHQKREKTGVKYEKTHSLDHEHILSGILRCPLCGSGMYGNVNRKKKKDGTLYKDYFYYACKHRRLVAVSYTHLVEEDSGGWYGLIFPDWMAWNSKRIF